ncbi:IPExxxVDY family protein [Weeksellaceae bacterium TAE3-ERU29]|nr:IPExxxVDY family protein [Weeksellaceae bacterium TAE3-ERU29]
MPYLLDDEFDDEFTLYGIKTNNIKEYKFIYLLNKSLLTQFKRIEDLDVKFKENTYCFSNYYHFDEISGNDCYLLQNLSQPLKNLSQQNSLFSEVTERHSLLKKHAFYDFFLKLNGNITQKPSFTLSLQKLNFIQHIKFIELTDKEKRLLII